MNIKKYLVKILKTAIPIIAVAAFVIIIYGTSSHNDKIKTVAENARISIKERKKTPTYEEIVISSGKKEISGEDAILIRYAKTVFEENGLSGVKIVLKNSEGEKIAETETSENATQGTELPLYMEEKLLDFKLKYGFENAKDIYITTYPQCYTDTAPDDNGRTLNIELQTGENKETVFKFIDSLNEKGAAIYVCNIAFTDDDGNTVKAISRNNVKKDEITVQNDTDK